MYYWDVVMILKISRAFRGDAFAFHGSLEAMHLHFHGLSGDAFHGPLWRYIYISWALMAMYFMGFCGDIFAFYGP